MQKLPPGVQPGLLVEARGDLWIVAEATPFCGCALVTLEGRGVGNFGDRARLLSPFDDLVPARAAGRLRRRSRERLIASVLAAIARRRTSGGLWTAAEGAFDLLPWQLAPALAAIGGATRLLLADSVGLGKTVQAALVLSELLARGLVERALVLTPAALRHAWAEELSRRFGIAAAVLDYGTLHDLTRALPVGANPWAVDPVVITSIDLAKRADVHSAVDERPIDLLVVDEAHHATPGSDRGAVVERLARRAGWILLCSATPHDGDPRAFRFLLDLGRTGGASEPGMLTFRRRAVDVARAPSRRVHRLAIQPTAAERALLDAVGDYARALRHGPCRSVPAVQLVAAVLARRATSTALAVERTLRRRLSLLDAAGAAADSVQPTLPWLELEEADDQPSPEQLGASGLSSVVDECDRLRVLVPLAVAASVGPSKLTRLTRLLARVQESAVIFSEFRDTLEACAAAIAPIGPTLLVHGGMDVGARADAVGAFNDGRARFLLATDVAGEGLNLQDRCRLVITIEWPWSPQKLEQRIGRVDRIGQRRRVHAVHLTTRDSYEDHVVARMLGRADRAARDLQEQAGGPDADAIEHAVFGETEPVGADRVVPVSASAFDWHARAEATRLAKDRALLARATRHGASTTGWALPPRCRASRRVAVVYETVVVGSGGRLDLCSVVAIEVTLGRLPASRQEWAWLCRALPASPPIREAAMRATPSAPVSRAIVERLTAIETSLMAESGGAIQTSLFDRRSVRDARARQDVRAALRRHVREKVARLASAPSGSVELRLLAVLPLP